MIASTVGHTEAVKLLLAAGADVNARTPKGLTSLEAASAKGHTKVVRLLQAAGARE